MSLVYDVIFVDLVTPNPYDTLTLETQALGGTEATVIRIAEGLGSLGLQIAIVQHNLKGPTQGQHCMFLPLDMLTKCSTSVLVVLRSGEQSSKLFSSFNNSKKFSWQHDLPNAELITMRDSLTKHDVTVVGVSRWHKTDMRRVLCDVNQTVNPKVTYIYNPVMDHIFVPKDLTVKYDKTKLVWMSSPHKGLEEALDVFDRLRDVSGIDFRLHVYNPGYMPIRGVNSPNVVYRGAHPAKVGWQAMSEALCLFYPTQWQETFGLVAAEAQAVHCPVACYEVAALAETVSGKGQKMPINDTKALIDNIIKWHNGERPNVYGNNNFRLSEVVKQWVQLFRKPSQSHVY